MEQGKLKKCGFCGENIPVYSGRCPFCGSLLDIRIDGEYREKSENPDNSGAGEVQEKAFKPEEASAADGETGKPCAERPEGADGSKNEKEAEASEYNWLKKGLPADGQIHAYDSRSGDQEESPAKPLLSNGIKVLLTVIASLVPGIGQLIGIITAIIFMNTEDDADRRSFGVALLVASLVVFVFACAACSILAIAAASMRGY